MTTVFTLNKTFHKEDSLTHKSYTFKLDKPYEKLVFSLLYLPKPYDNEQDSLKQIKECFNRGGVDISEAQAKSELPLNNLITISLCSPEKLIGTAHRHLNNAEYFISETESSYGFLTSQITAGTWEITLSIHCILSEKVDVFIKVDCL